MLIELTDFRRETGRCWVASLPTGCVFGDDVDAPRRSVLRLFEGEHELGPAHSVHDDIRRFGAGRFSHWGNQLLFSTRTNDDPWPGRLRAVAPVGQAELEREQAAWAGHVASSEEARYAFMKSWFARSGSEPQALFSLRLLAGALRSLPIELEGARMLEVGSSPSLGLPLALAMCGVRKVVANNVIALPERVPVEFVRSLNALLSLSADVRRTWAEVTIPSADGVYCRPNEAWLEVMGSTDAARLSSPGNEFDVVFSFSVLEHVRELPDVLRTLSRLMSADGAMIHFVDLRDHTSFQDPLAYLRLSGEQFALQYGPEHNRWRLSEYRSMFEAAGLDVVRTRVAGAPPLTPDGQTDMFEMALRGVDRVFSSSATDLAPVEQRIIESLHPDFRDYDPLDLRPLVVEIIARARSS